MEDQQIKKAIKGYSLFEWVVSICIILIVIVICVKLILSDFSFNISEFSLNDFLSLFMAVFSISLAVAFYYKSTDSSSKFYDNTYKFTKDISETLGVIKAEFGEKLQHMKEDNEKIYKTISPKYVAEKEINDKENEIEQRNLELIKDIEQKEALINDLLEKTQMSNEERENFRRTFSIQEHKIQDQMHTISELRESLFLINNTSERTLNAIKALIRRMKRNSIDSDDVFEINNLINSTMFPEYFKERLNEEGIFTTEEGLNETGHRLIKLFWNSPKKSTRIKSE